MRTWTKYCAGLMLMAGLTPVVRAQAPGAGAGAQAAGGASAAAATPGAAPAGAQTIWAKLGLSCDQLKACKARFCASPIGGLAQNMMKPVNMFSGGMFQCCPAVNPADLAKPPDNAEGAAAQIKKDEAEAKARREAVRYLGTVDCNRWPEAKEGLVNALRTDRNECVRLEAAYALGRGCCCNKLTMEKLRLTVEGSDKDGNPPETSMRVRAAAAAALNHCLACVTEKMQEGGGSQEEKPKPPPGDGKLPEPDKNGESAAYNKRIESMSMTQIMQRARYTLDHADLALPVSRAPVASAPRSGLVDIIQKAFTYSGPPSDGPQVIQEAPMTASTTIRPVPQPASSLPASSQPVFQPVKNVKPMSYTPVVPAPAPQQPAVKSVTPATSSARPVSPYQSSTTSSQPANPMPDLMASSQPAKSMPEPMPVRQASVELSSSPFTKVTPVNYRPATPAQPSYGISAGEMQQMLFTLNNSLYPDQRERAAAQLASADWRSSPQVMHALVTGARKDSAPTVRVGCVRALAKMHANTTTVIDTLQLLRGDSDPRVRQEVGVALAALSTQSSAKAVVPAGSSYSR